MGCRGGERKRKNRWLLLLMEIFCWSCRSETRANCSWVHWQGQGWKEKGGKSCCPLLREWEEAVGTVSSTRELPISGVTQIRFMRELAWFLIPRLPPVPVFLSSASAWYYLENMALGPATCPVLPSSWVKWTLAETFCVLTPATVSVQTQWESGLVWACALLVSWYWPHRLGYSEKSEYIKKMCLFNSAICLSPSILFTFSWENKYSE